MTCVTTSIASLSRPRPFVYARAEMPSRMHWLATVVRLASAPVFFGALFLLLERQPSWRDVGAGFGLVVLGAIHVLYWWRPWPANTKRAVGAGFAMVLTNSILIHLLGISQPLLWLYPALVVGSGFRAPAAAVGVGLLGLAASVPVDLESSLVDRILGPSHFALLSVVLAGLAMTAVRQLIAVNADLHATKAELAELAVAGERERLGRELHDLLGRTLSLIAVKAELAGRLSAHGDPSAAAELRDVQQLARLAIREVREAVAGDRTASVAAELAAAQLALRTVGIEVSVVAAPDIDPAHEATIAWVLREAVTNVVKHSGARTCHVLLVVANGVTNLEVADDGNRPVEGISGIGLAGLADRVHALGGTFDAARLDEGGFRLHVRLDVTTPAAPRVTIAL